MKTIDLKKFRNKNDESDLQEFKNLTAHTGGEEEVLRIPQNFDIS